MNIPQNITVSINGSDVSIKGPLGEVKRKIGGLVSVTSDANEIKVAGPTKALINATEAHLNNMINGVTKGFKRKFKIVYAHFPITIEAKGKDIIIKNFLGEKQSRKAKLVGETKIEVKGQEITISSSDIEALGQTISNVKAAMKIRKKDSRVFQDGMYPVE